MKKDERKRFSEKGHGAHTVGSSDSRNETDADVVYQATEEGVPHNSLWMQSSSQSQENDIMNQGVLDDSFVSQGDKKIDAERGSKKRQRQGDCGDEDGKDAGGVIPRRETQEATYALTEHQAKDEEETKRTKKEFIAKIHKILEDAELENNKHIISWGPDGKSFKVHNPGAFVKEIMPRYSAATKFRSFEKMVSFLSYYRLRTVDCLYLFEFEILIGSFGVNLILNYTA